MKKEAKLSASEVPREEVVRICGVGVFFDCLPKTFGVVGG